ncbi:WD40-repeat-containing domain protein [Leucosporidium creatinivorum]|uniref:WD40-repeat-containing domain protein n=1 Tax=Leucosporidium creatinivorum TaxID=106004 RepID=A0A1Y2FAA1_9BASI|nr:WD40-repeat-containing domain protein [Leucosporidium creatinivorum]
MAKRKATTGAAAPAPKASSSKPQGKRARFDGPPPAAPSTKKASAPAPKSKQAKQAAKIPKTVPTPPAPATFTVSAGSYERLLYGLSCNFEPVPSTSTGLPYTLAVTPVFSFPAHLSSLKSVAGSLLPSPGTGSERKVGGKYLVSGGTDEVVKVWDLRRRKEVGTLEGDTAGNITCLRFVAQRNMLLAASTESGITLYRVRDWVLLRSLKGHKGRVNSVDAHPDGRVALSVGQDKMLRMWDLVAGKAVATMKIGTEGDLVRWNTDGTKFAIICGSNLTVYGIDMTVLHSLQAPSRFHDVHFCYFPLDVTDPTQCEYLFVACEDGKTRVFDVTSPSTPVDDPSADPEALPTLEPIAQLSGHANRVKMLDLLEVALPGSTVEEPASTVVVTSVSSDGKINLYDLAILASKKTALPAGSTELIDIEPSASHDTEGTRLTCVNAVGMAAVKKGANVGEEEEDDEESDSEDDSEEDGEDIAFGSEDELEGEEESEAEEEEEEEGEEE